MTNVDLHGLGKHCVGTPVFNRIDPDDPYPKRIAGHIRATLADGQVVEMRQSHLRGGTSKPLSRTEIETRRVSNARYGGWLKGRGTSISRRSGDGHG